ncbi:hypothetical protein O181_023663 [Austropuccinia psidii MF-1]|uniref:Anaphase-promoting complex subunit 2 n=1 Tax=Austropuccinia psidii MF-1 TaxID=1389203 RepID=A0A9Q3CHG9_9BASI|nr:hypothetical protein [Austropuccinia psidii MF-1]
MSLIPSANAQNQGSSSSRHPTSFDQEIFLGFFQKEAFIKESLDLTQAIKIVDEFLKPIWPVPLTYLPRPSPPSDQVVHALAYILQFNRQEELFNRYKDSIHSSFKYIQLETLQSLNQFKDSSDYQLTLKLIARWHIIFLTWYEPLRILTPEDTSAYNLYSKHFYSLLLSCLPDRFPSGLKILFTLDLTFTPLLSNSSSPSLFPPIKQLANLGLLKRFQSILFSVGYDAIDQRIQESCCGKWLDSIDSSLESTLNWFRQHVGIWLFKILESAQTQSDLSSSEQLVRVRVLEIMTPAMSRFEYHIYKSLSELRINELFDIIIDFPDTMPVLQDLKICMTKTDQRSLLVRKLREANARRLLHPGADTQDIITQYISLMKALRILDPPGVLLSYVAHPVRTYLRTRQDTIRCIVTSLVEPGHTLGDELDRASQDENGTNEWGSSLPIKEEGDYGSTNWTPDPVDAPIGYQNVFKEDVIESLVSIYETRDGFVKELQNLLAGRLLAIKGFDATQELTRIEILKRKFGEANLQPCDIMLKDIVDSKRVDTMIHEAMPDVPIHVIIISRLFWPDLATTAFKYSPRLVELQKQFEKAYTLQKVDRRLRWFPQLGSLELDVELQDRTLSLEVTPLQASVIELFATADVWTTAQLEEALRIKSDSSLLRNALYYWSNHEVVKEIESSTWKLFETRESFNSSLNGVSRHVIQEVTTHIDGHTKTDKFRAFSGFVIGMLTNLGSLSTDRIYGMMNNVVPTFKGTTKEELLELLETLQRGGSIRLLDHQWKLIK